MEANKPTKRGGRYCVAGTPQQVSCKNTSYTPGIRMHSFPKDPKTCQQWVKFVRRHRVDFIQPTKYSSLCSAHFEESCYYRQLAEEGSGYRVLERGSVPTKDTSFVPENENNEITARGKRKVSRSRKICITRIICISDSKNIIYMPSYCSHKSNRIQTISVYC